MNKTYLRLTDFSAKFAIDKDKISELLKTIPVIESLKILSSFENLLISDQDHNHNLQRKIAEYLFNSNSKIFKFLMDCINLGKSDCIFHHQQFLYCISLIISEGDIQYKTNDNFKIKIGIILLYINDILTPSELKSLKDEELIAHIWQLYHFHSIFNIDLGLEMARAYHLFFEKNYNFGIEEAFYKLIGVEFKKYWACCLGFIFYWFIIDDQKSQSVNDLPIIFNPMNWFKNTRGINNSDIQKTLNLFSDNISDLRNNLKRKGISLGHEVLNFETLLEKPILKIDSDNYICLSLGHLVYAATKGIFEILRKSSLIKKDDTLKQQCEEATSKIFHSYIIDMLSFVYPSSGIFKLLHFGKYSNIEIGDAIIDCNQHLIHIEVKAKNIQKKYKLSSEYNSIECALEGFLTKEGFIQIDKRIKDFKNGRIKIGNVLPKNIKYYWPILISCIDTIPSDIVFRKLYKEILDRENIFKSDDIAPFTILSLKEFDYLLKYLLNGRTLIELLIDHNSTPQKRAKDFCNYLINDIKPRIECFPDHLKKSYDNILLYLQNELNLKIN